MLPKKDSIRYDISDTAGVGFLVNCHAETQQNVQK